MIRTRTSLAAMYLTLTFMLVLLPAVCSAATPSPSEQQLVVLLHTMFKENPHLEPYLEGILKTAANMSEGPALPQGATISPLMNLFLTGLRNLQNTQGNNNGGGEQNNNTVQPRGDILSALTQNSVVQELMGIASKQITEAQQEALKNNVTIEASMSSILGMLRPVEIIQTLLSSHPARTFIQNKPAGKVSEACYEDIMDTFDSVVALKMWAIQMLDALGKPTAGVERGSFYFVGSYDQCYQIKPHISRGDVIGSVTQTQSRDFGTRFCRTDITIPDTFIDSLHVDTHGVHLKLTWGLCLPDTCHVDDVKGLLELDTIKNLSPPRIESAYCYEDEDITSDSSAIAAISGVTDYLSHMICCSRSAMRDEWPLDTTSVLSVFGVMILIGTLVDFYKQSRRLAGNGKSLTQVKNENGLQAEPPNHVIVVDTKTDDGLPSGYMPHQEGNCPLPTITNGNVKIQNGFSERQQNDIQRVEVGENQDVKKQDSFMTRFVVCFSLYTNIPKILNAKATSGSITCIHGIRFLSLTWVVLGHTYNYGIISQDETFTADNLLDFVPIMQRFTYQAVVAGGFSVDTFFVLSAFLLTWLHLKETDKKKKKCTVSDGVMYYFHRFWRLTPIYMIVIMSFGCLYRYLGSGPFWPSTIWAAEHCKSVWWTNLLYMNNLVKTNSQCMGWTWYLANDMQFYVISPLFLAFMYMLPVVGGVLTTLLLVMGVSIAFWREYEINGNFFTMKSDGGAFWNEVYTVPWCRVACWAVGMLLGFLIYKRDRKPLRNKSFVFLGWIVSTAVALALVYSTYSENKDGGTEWTNTQRAFYEAFGRPVWGLCVSWVIFACYNNMGGLVNSILSWNGFIPLSRLTYAAYLVHPICMMVYVFSRRTMLHVNDYNIIYLYLGHLCVTYMVALICSAAFEAPAMALEKLLFRRGHKK